MTFEEPTLPAQGRLIAPSVLLSGRALAAFLFAFAIADLLLSYVYLVYLFQEFPLWKSVIHEQGIRNFWQTILFYEHVLREIPLDTIYALCIVGFARWYGIRPARPSLHRGRFNIQVAAGVLAFILVAWALASTYFYLGAGAVRDNLFQWKIDDTTFGFGLHWHFHWLGMMAVFFATGGVVKIAQGLLGCSTSRDRSGLLFWLAAFLGLTVIFGFSWKSFNDPRFLGHQAREVVTFFPLAVLPALASLIVLERDWSSPDPKGLRVVPLLTYLGLFIITMGVLLIPLWGVSVIDYASRQDLGLVYLFASHNFEHLPDYLYIIALTMFLGINSKRK